MAAEDYVGPPGHEKKFHKTHFKTLEWKLRSTKESPNVWVKVGVGKYKLVRKDEQNGRETRSN